MVDGQPDLTLGVENATEVAPGDREIRSCLDRFQIASLESKAKAIGEQTLENLNWARRASPALSLPRCFPIRGLFASSRHWFRYKITSRIIIYQLQESTFVDNYLQHMCNIRHSNKKHKTSLTSSLLIDSTWMNGFLEWPVCEKTTFQFGNKNQIKNQHVTIANETWRGENNKFTTEKSCRRQVLFNVQNEFLSRTKVSFLCRRKKNLSLHTTALAYTNQKVALQNPLNLKKWRSKRYWKKLNVPKL